ncbi:MAG: T9SS type A sorting domain-containing protein [Candidatus Cloacimonadota bacterium]|nr:MAG: T9SS type A sorting domain-containing protein [Candidatus Cloacimonadota bacterium]
MNFSGLLIFFLLFTVNLFSGTEPLRHIERMLPTPGGENSYFIPGNPPPIDSFCLVYYPVWYGGYFSSPQNYPNAKHITNVMVGSYYFPVVIWESGGPWGLQSLFSYWNDMLKCWTNPDSFTSNNGMDTSRGNVCADSKGNLHFVWHQSGNPDGYEIFYTRAFLDTTGLLSYDVDRSPVMLSETNGEDELFPAMAVHGDTVMIIFNVGYILDEHAIGYNLSTDGGDSWIGRSIAYEHSSTMPGSWMLCSIAPGNLNLLSTTTYNEDMWVSFSFDYTGNGCMDIVALHWEATSNTWALELAAAGQSGPFSHALCCPAIVVDYNQNPHIIYQENMGTGGGLSSLMGYNECGPAGTLFYTSKIGGTWSTPEKVMFPRYEFCNYLTGYPSAGIAMDNTIYFSATQPESATQDTNAYLPFNVHYARFDPQTATVTYCGKVSHLTFGDSANAIYVHIPYFVQEVNVPPNTQGPGFTWCQMFNGSGPSGVYYCHKDTIIPRNETKTTSTTSYFKLYQNYPNPFRVNSLAKEEAIFRFSLPDRSKVSLKIYDVTGRVISEPLSGKYPPGHYNIPFKPKSKGIYFYRLESPYKTTTGKIVIF